MDGLALSRVLLGLALLLALLALAGTAEAAFPGANGPILFSHCEDVPGCNTFHVYNSELGSTPVFPLMPGEEYDDPAVTADGRLIAAERCEAVASGNFDCGISVVGTDGANPHAITPTSPGMSDDYPSFSPDGGTIAFTRGPDDNSTAAVWLMRADGTGAHALTSGTDLDERPEFTPNGASIVFDRISGSETHLWAMNADGSDQRELTSDSSFEDRFPSISPDGATVAFQRCSASAPCAIWVMGLDGSNAHAVSSPIPGDVDEYPAFSPDGGHIAFDRVDITGSSGVLDFAIAAGTTTEMRTSGVNFAPAWGRVPTPSIDAPPRIGGTPRVGQILLAVTGTTSWGGYSSLQWLRCDAAGNGCAAIPGATGGGLLSNYTPTNADIGHMLRARQTQASAGGSVTADSTPTATVAREPGLSIPRSARLSRKRALIKLGCPSTERDVCSGTLTLTARLTVRTSGRHTVTAGRVRYRIAAGKHRTFRLKLSRRVLAALLHKHRLELSAATTTVDGVGNKTIVHRRLTLRQPVKRRRH